MCQTATALSPTHSATTLIPTQSATALPQLHFYRRIAAILGSLLMTSYAVALPLPLGAIFVTHHAATLATISIGAIHKWCPIIGYVGWFGNFGRYRTWVGWCISQYQTSVKIVCSSELKFLRMEFCRIANNYCGIALNTLNNLEQTNEWKNRI